MVMTIIKTIQHLKISINLREVDEIMFQKYFFFFWHLQNKKKTGLEIGDTPIKNHRCLTRLNMQGLL
jgi:hypothetical protein